MQKQISILLLTLLIPGFPALGGDATLMVKLIPANWMNVWLTSDQLAGPKRGGSDNPKQKLQGFHAFKQLKPGSYTIKLDPDYDDWAAHCIGYTNIVLVAGQNRRTIPCPTNQLALEVDLPEVPAGFELFGRIPLRVERIDASGIDPIYRQWLMVSKHPPHQGTLSYLAPGNYRVTSFRRDKKGGDDSDVCQAEVVLDADTFKRGRLTVNLTPIK